MEKRGKGKWFLISIICLICLIILAIIIVPTILMAIAEDKYFQEQFDSLRRTPTYCDENILNRYYESLKTGDVTICDEFAKRKYARSEPDGYYCLLPNSSRLYGEENCIINIATTLQNISLCKIFSIEECLKNIKDLASNPDLCELLKKEDSSYYPTADVDRCYKFIARIKNDSVYCERIKDTYSPYECYSNVAFNTEDVTICDKIEIAKDKYHCYSELNEESFRYHRALLFENFTISQKLRAAANAKITYDLCSQIESDYDYNNCIEELESINSKV